MLETGNQMKKWLLAAALTLSGSIAQAAEPAVNRTTAVVKSLDAVGGTVMLAHEPVPALSWPAMTMPFKISPALAKGIQVGQKVSVEFQAQGMNATVTKITVTK